MTNTIRLLMAQINITVGALTDNTNTILAALSHAKATRANIVLFPELTITGYPPEDLLFRSDFLAETDRCLQQLVENVDDRYVILGAPFSENGVLYNGAIVCYRKKIIARYAKQRLPNYGVFDEKRYFVAGDKPCVVDMYGIPMGILICEDLWRETPVKRTVAAGAEMLLSLHASPYHHQKQTRRYDVLKARCAENHRPIFYAHLVGGQDELIFDGGSMVFDADGNCIVQAPFYKSDYRLVDIVDGVIQPQPLTPLPEPDAEIYAALKLGVHDYVHKNHFKGVLLGLSGGIDSALTAAIAADAIGPENVTGVLMPSRYTAQISIDYALAEAHALGIETHTVPIDDLIADYTKLLSPIFGDLPIDITEQNLQARARGMILMALSNKFRKLLLTTGNKSEMAVGYATLYGDMAGGFAVIKDLYKHQVYALANYRNTLSPVIPGGVITRAPSAELAPNQQDSDTLPPYPVLDEIVRLHVEEDKSPEAIRAEGFKVADIQRVVRLIHLNEYKRRQAAPGIRISQKAFGRDRRYPITSGFIPLTDEIADFAHPILGAS